MPPHAPAKPPMRSYLALLATFVLLFGVDSFGVVSAIADAETAGGESSSRAVKPTPSPAFTDLGGNVHREAIQWLAANGMAQGHVDGTFRPADPLTRGQLASLLERSLGLEPSPCAARCAPLVDLESSIHAPAIRTLIASGISYGYGDGTYRPNGHVTRGQMATYMAGAFDLSLNDAVHPFTDVAGTEHEAEIAAVFRAGFTNGATLSTFEPGSRVRRDQAASLLSRSLGFESEPITAASVTEPTVETSEDASPAEDPGASQSPASWQAAWDSRDYDILRAWYRDNTGIAAAGLTEADLTPSGSVRTTHDGQVIEGLNINGSVDIRHDNVTVRNTMIVGSGIGVNVPWAARTDVNNFTVENVSIIGTEPTATDAAGQGVGATYATVTIRNVYVSNRRGGFRLSNQGDDLVEYSMVENIRHVPPAHNTGVSYRGGSGVQLTRNWIEGSTSAAFSLYPDAGPITAMTARENLFDGGTYSIRGGTDKTYRDELADIRFIANRFTYNHQYGPRAAWCGSCPGNEWTGNNYLNDGKPA